MERMVRDGSPFSLWRSGLRKQGFRLQGTGGRKGIYARRRAGPLGQAIGVLVDPSRGEAFNIQLNINMALRCAEPPHDVVILAADLSEQGVRIEVPWAHDPLFATWWPREKNHSGWTALVEKGLPWLDRHVDLEALTEYFEQEYRLHEQEAQDSDHPPWPLALARKLRLAHPPARRAHHQYLLWLSMLYEESNVPELARSRLEAYAESLGSRITPVERLRLERHFKALVEEIS